MNEQTLEQKLQALRSFSRFDPDSVTRFGEVLRGLDDWALFRMNPLHFAEEHGFDQALSLDLFIHGARVGLFDFSYELICAKCGGLEYSLEALDLIPSDTFHCTTCNVDVSVTLDDQVQVAFTINPSVRPIQIDIYADAVSYNRGTFSADFVHNPKAADYFSSQLRGYSAIGPDETERITFEAEPGLLYRVISIENHSTLFVQCGQERGALPQIVDVDLLGQSFAPQRVEVAAGEVTLSIRNLTKAIAGVQVYRTRAEELVAVLQQHPSEWRPFLTGKMLLNNQSFRDLFRIQHLAPGLRLNVCSLTILFTDLKNSTEIYGRAGDAFAYNLVQEHFDLLIAAVRRHAGSIVKTMGDAIMATFSTPQDGVGAALEMAQQIAGLNERLKQQGYETGIKIGLNEGAVLAVNADDRLDYFGQNVNVAARVQGLAQAGEIWLTETVFSSPQVSQILARAGYRPHKQSAVLKGVGQPTIVFQCVQR